MRHCKSEITWLFWTVQIKASTSRRHPVLFGSNGAVALPQKGLQIKCSYWNCEPIKSKKLACNYFNEGFLVCVLARIRVIVTWPSPCVYPHSRAKTFQGLWNKFASAAQIVSSSAVFCCNPSSRFIRWSSTAATFWTVFIWLTKVLVATGEGNAEVCTT